MNQQEFNRYRTILAYHGCDQSVADKVLIHGEQLEKSENSYDWLGAGIYFWEHGPNRALEWAKQSRQIKNPAVVGAVINLGNCFDLFDREAVESLTQVYPIFKEASELAGEELPVNKPVANNDPDQLLRHLDCAMINWSLDEFAKSNVHYDSVRGLFPEGEACFPGSSIKAKSHIQVAIRNTSCILGYFKPN